MRFLLVSHHRRDNFPSLLPCKRVSCMYYRPNILYLYVIYNLYINIYTATEVLEMCQNNMRERRKEMCVHRKRPQGIQRRTKMARIIPLTFRCFVGVLQSVDEGARKRRLAQGVVGLLPNISSSSVCFVRAWCCEHNISNRTIDRPKC